jgi:hypothetical protein
MEGLKNWVRPKNTWNRMMAEVMKQKERAKF